MRKKKVKQIGSSLIYEIQAALILGVLLVLFKKKKEKVCN